MITNIIRSVCGLCLIGGVALAQSPAATRSQPGFNNAPARTFDVQRMSFDLWCQETQQYAFDRCAARRPEDVKAFEDYRAAVERFEIQFQRQREEQRSVQERINRDPTNIPNWLQDTPVR